MNELDEAIAALEAVPWRRVPGVSSETAAAFTLQLDAARDGFDAEGSGVSFDGP